MPEAPRALVEPGSGRIVAEHVHQAGSARERSVGLLGRLHLDPAEALWLTKCSAIHTCFMRFPIDVAFLDKRGTIVKLGNAVPPWRVLFGGFHARQAVELAAGTLERNGIGVGTVLLQQ